MRRGELWRTIHSPRVRRVVGVASLLLLLLFLAGDPTAWIAGPQAGWEQSAAHAMWLAAGGE